MDSQGQRTQETENKNIHIENDEFPNQSHFGSSSERETLMCLEKNNRTDAGKKSGTPSGNRTYDSPIS